MGSQARADVSNGRGSVPFRIALAIAALSWILLFLLGIYTEIVDGTLEILLVDLILLAAPFLIARWFLKRSGA